MLTHQVLILPKSTWDHRNSLSLLSTCIPDSIQPVPPTLPTQWDPKPEANQRHTQTPRPSTALAGHRRLKRTREGETNTIHVWCRPSTTDSVLGRLRRPSEVGVSMPRRGKLANVHGEGTPPRGKSCFWMCYEIGEGLPAVCQNSSLLTLVHACKSSWPSPLSVLAEYPALGRGALQHCLSSQGGSPSQRGAWWPLRQKEKTPGLRPLGQISPAFYLEGRRAPTFCLSCASCQRPSKQKLYSCEVLWEKKVHGYHYCFFFSVQ